MRPLEPTPASFQRYAEIGGILEFRVFEDAGGTDEDAFEAVCAALPEADRDALRMIGFRVLDTAQFYGASYDADSDSLLKRGTWRAGEAELKDPRLRDLDDVYLNGGGGLPTAGQGGEFAYAFSTAPYRLQAPPKEIQSLFDNIRHVVMPPGLAHVIRDWASPDLPTVSQYFKAGMEWWGVFLFTVYVPDWRRHTVILGSTTD